MTTCPSPGERGDTFPGPVGCGRERRAPQNPLCDSSSETMKMNPSQTLSPCPAMLTETGIHQAHDAMQCWGLSGKMGSVLCSIMSWRHLMWLAPHGMDVQAGRGELVDRGGTHSSVANVGSQGTGLEESQSPSGRDPMGALSLLSSNCLHPSSTCTGS